MVRYIGDGTDFTPIGEQVAFCAIKPRCRAGREYAVKITSFQDTMKNIKAAFSQQQLAGHGVNTGPGHGLESLSDIALEDLLS